MERLFTSEQTDERNYIFFTVEEAADRKPPVLASNPNANWHLQVLPGLAEVIILQGGKGAATHKYP